MSYRRMTYRDRLKLESLYNTKKFSLRALGKLLGFSASSICDELKHGYYEKLNSDYTTTKLYSADRAQQYSDWAITTKRPALKIGNDYKFVAVVERLIVNDRKSPDEVTHILREEYPNLTQVCTTTLYSYIYSGFFPAIKTKHLFFKGNRRKKRGSPIVRLPHSRSIEERAAKANDRTEFGHWEMDSVIGSKTRDNTIVVLTERKTRMEFIFRSNDKTALSTVKVLNKLERRFGRSFAKVFKSITTDNGSEFSADELMERSVFGCRRNRTTVYHCHPYSSWERGSNENQNRYIRLFIPKGVPIRTVPDSILTIAQEYINNKRRRMFNYRTSKELFDEELRKLNIL